jgi:hypothetical protein
VSPLVVWLFLLVVVAALAVATAYRRRAPDAAPPSAPPPNDLSSLGLSTVRPRLPSEDAPERTAHEPDSDEQATVRLAEEQPALSDPQEPARVLDPKRGAQSSDAADPQPAPYASATSPLWRDDGHRAAALLVGSLGAHVGGQVAVLRTLADGTYAVDALAFSDRPPHRPASATPLDALDSADGLTELNGPARDALVRLGAAHAGGQAVARALAAPPAERALLAVSLPPGAPALDEPLAIAISRYTDLLADISRLATPHAEPDFLDADSEAQTDAPPQVAPKPAAETPRTPRLELLDGELQSARADGRALCFALVTLAAADDILEHETEVIADAASALEDRLRSWPEVRRVEPFGDLVFGIFLDGPLTDERRAAMDEHAASAPQILAGLLEHAEAMASAGAVRAAAADALHAAYEQRLPLVCVPADEA